MFEALQLEKAQRIHNLWSEFQKANNRMVQFWNDNDYEQQRKSYCAEFSILREVGFHKLTHLVQSFPRLFSVPEGSTEHAVLNLHNGDVHTFYIQNKIVRVHLTNGGHDRKKRKAPDFDHLGRAPHSGEQSPGEGHVFFEHAYFHCRFFGSTGAFQTAFQYPGFSSFAHQSFQICIVRFNKQTGPVENDQLAVSSNACGCGQLAADLGYRNRQ
ncbi:hypothetical protein T4B_11447 [Trichinella pseudospiralis]|uniref:Uncharacterized protein n=2 Tax=Trichinella pseudospiralis TaxID=6337 RepID=A0A0V1F8I4_TRIPS|nr:hypothetical protein T4D_16620 [Trichinella pseudospiralis]KRZ20839.1 hypothetical protein T4B_11447 [Trichinella pseudospiralis]